MYSRTATDDFNPVGFGTYSIDGNNLRMLLTFANADEELDFSSVILARDKSRVVILLSKPYRGAHLVLEQYIGDCREVLGVD